MPRQSPPSVVSPLSFSACWFLLRSRCYHRDLFWCQNHISKWTGKWASGPLATLFLRFWKVGIELLDIWKPGFLHYTNITYFYLVSIRKFVNYGFVRILAEFFKAALKVTSNVAHLLFCVFSVAAGCFFSTIREVNAILFHQLHQILGEVLSSKTHFLNCMWQSKPLINGDSWSQGISWI